MSLYLLLNGSLLIVLLTLSGWYVWLRFSGEETYPVAWNEAKKSKRISKTVGRLERTYRDKARFFNWWLQVERLKREKIEGDFAELGVYKGRSAKVLHHMDPSRIFHLFDTFNGFSREDLEGESGEAATYTPIHFADTDQESVIQYINGNQNIRIHKGYFPGTEEIVRDCRFALVNMDADLYNPTHAGLEFFYSRLVPGGVILIHDYNHKWPGIMKAVDEFAKKIPEVVAFVPDTDGTAMIIKNR